MSGNRSLSVYRGDDDLPTPTTPRVPKTYSLFVKKVFQILIVFHIDDIKYQFTYFVKSNPVLLQLYVSLRFYTSFLSDSDFWHLESMKENHRINHNGRLISSRHSVIFINNNSYNKITINSNVGFRWPSPDGVSYMTIIIIIICNINTKYKKIIWIKHCERNLQNKYIMLQNLNYKWNKVPNREKKTL